LKGSVSRRKPRIGGSGKQWVEDIMFRVKKEKLSNNLVVNFLLGGLECVGHSFASAALFVFLRDVWIRTQRAADALPT
jgi:hypothetical protein